MATLDTTTLSLLFVFFGAFYSCLLLVALRLRGRRPRRDGRSHEAQFSLIVPAKNEEAVLARTLEGLVGLEYPTDQMEILVVDDGSDDQTFEIAQGFAREHPGLVRVVRTDGSGGGKPEALNAAMRDLLAASGFRSDDGWIIGVFDADGVPDPDLLEKAEFEFSDAGVGAVQASVRIVNRHTSVLGRMQDLEFSAFSRVTQMIRSRVSDSASLGGNGQFVRADALRRAVLGRNPLRFWRPGSLTEDLELSTRLTLHGWKVRHLPDSYVHQEGVERVSDLFRQRTRWAWGSLQVFIEYVLKLRFATARGIPLRRRLDIAVSLSLFLLSPFVLGVWLLTAFAALDVIQVTNQLPVLVTIGISFGFFPLVIWGMWTQKEYRGAALVGNLLLFTAYTYHWLPCLYVALLRVIGGDDPKWFKTRRVEELDTNPHRAERLLSRLADWWTPRRLAASTVFAGLAILAGYLRWVRAGYLDSFEDPYQHWWISGYMLQTGQYYDSFSAMTRGNWLPLYDFFGAAVLLSSGIHSMTVLKATSLVFSIATMAVIFCIASRHSRMAAWVASAAFAFSPSAIIAGSMALPEAATGLALVLGYYLVAHAKGRPPIRVLFAAVCLAAATALRYESWIFIGAMVVYFVGQRRWPHGKGDLLLAASPAIAFMALWWAFTSRWGYLPDVIVSQTSVDVRYKASIDALVPVQQIVATFWLDYVSLSFLLVVIGSAYALFVVRREFLAFVLFVFYAAEFGWIAFGFGNPSIRYLYVTVPGLAVLTGMAISDLCGRARAAVGRGRSNRTRAAIRGAVVVLTAVTVLAVTSADAYSTAFPDDPPGLFMQAMERAGLFLRDRPLPDGKLLVSESPIAAYLSEYPPSRMIGSSQLPDDPLDSTAYLEANAAYLVVVTVPWYKLRVLYPALAEGENVAPFRLLYDASGPEYELGAHRVLVYEVLPAEVAAGG